MYQSLQSIGLKSYLDKYFFSREYLQECWLTKIDIFVGNLSDVQKLVLRQKFKPNITHLSANDLVHEIMIACAFYPQAFFNPSSGADLMDNGHPIEVKTINASLAEIERILNLQPDSRRMQIKDDNSTSRNNAFKKVFRRKFNSRFKKAAEQVNHSGIVYMVWDSDFVPGWENRKWEIGTMLKGLAEKRKHTEPKVDIKTIYFEDLRVAVAKK
ncbi:MAG: hypothetical protein Q7R93_01150 [bacterium]|nr:hypothetical protein [bacterium]